MIKITLRNPLDKTDLLPYWIQPFDNALARDWVKALKHILDQHLMLEKNFCFLGFPDTQRDLALLCHELNRAVYDINRFNATGTWQAVGLAEYYIEDWFAPDVVRYGQEYPVVARHVPRHSLGLEIKHQVMNRLHNHFEILQGTVEQLSPYYVHASDDVKHAIRQLNNLCHEIESLVLSQRKKHSEPEWVRPSQITTFLTAPRLPLTDAHRDLFAVNGYDRRFGTVYMHWCQIGKTLFEVWRDESAPRLKIGADGTEILYDTGATCEAITSLKYFSGEFDIEWGLDTVESESDWYKRDIDGFRSWLRSNSLDPNDIKLSLGYLPVGQVLLQESFGTTDPQEIWSKMSQYLDIYSIEVDGITAVYPYVWSDANYREMQIDRLKAGYRYHERKAE